MARIGIFGGAFDPVHNGHVFLAIEAMELAALDRVIVVPAATSPFKPSRIGAPPGWRLACVRAAFQGLPGIEVSDLEVVRGGVSYSIDTVREIAARHPGAELAFLIGADSLAGLPRWRAAGEIAALATFLVAVRPGWDPKAAAAVEAEVPGLRVRVLATTPIGISSSLVRARVASGRPIRGLVPQAIEESVIAQGPYRVADVVPP